MDTVAAASSISEMKQAEVQYDVSLRMLKKTLDLQQSAAQQLLQALPQPQPAPALVGSTAGGHIDTFA